MGSRLGCTAISSYTQGKHKVVDAQNRANVV